MKRLKYLIADTESLILFGVVILTTIMVATFADWYFKRKMKKSNEEMKIDYTKFLFLKHLIVFTIYLIGIGWGFLILPITKSFAHSILAGAGASTLILGLASQQILSNLMSGVFIVLNKSLKINDLIEIQGNKGKVIEITWHDTIIENEDKEKIVIPNNLITTTVLKKINKS